MSLNAACAHVKQAEIVVLRQQIRVAAARNRNPFLHLHREAPRNLQPPPRVALLSATTRRRKKRNNGEESHKESSTNELTPLEPQIPPLLVRSRLSPKKRGFQL